MKIAITGHTKGLGKALADAYSEHQVLGFSRTNGYDLQQRGVVDKILEQSKQCDIFINNAYVADKQTELFVRAVQQFENTNTLVINISSKWGWCPSDVIPEWNKQYVIDKIKQNNFFTLSSIKPNRKTLNVILGVVDTDMTSDLQCDFKMDPNRVAKTIKLIQELLDNQIAIQEIVIESNKVNWNNAKSNDLNYQSFINGMREL